MNMLQLRRALILFVSLSLLCGLVYPLAMTMVAQVFFPQRANGSLVTVGSRVAGSELIGQMFASPAYFHGRPSAAEPPYNASGSAGSNLGPSSARLMEQVRARVEKVRRENGMASDAPVPADLVLASASGLDPHIRPESALLQIPRIARERQLPESDVASLLSGHVEKPFLGLWGRERINVLRLNMDLDHLGKSISHR